MLVVLLAAQWLAAGPALVLTRATVWVSPVAEALRNATVVMEDGRIVAAGRLRVPHGAEVIDCAWLTVMGGFWNSHVHFFERKWENAAFVPAAELSETRSDDDAFWIHERVRLGLIR